MTGCEMKNAEQYRDKYVQIKEFDVKTAKYKQLNRLLKSVNTRFLENLLTKWVKVGKSGKKIITFAKYIYI